MRIVLLDSATAAALSQILPLLLLTLMVEFRRVELHKRGRSVRTTRTLLGVFFLVFGTFETAFVLSIDGELIPFAWSDLLAALTIFGLIAVLFALSLLEPPGAKQRDREKDDGLL
ncbi:Na+/H+ antiporter [Leifsonia xyli subsp. cynodontis DSM 46306]|uniref:Uncharacterized protein n=1 Tax=Leifsonia xyli subsp. cynodontis DSM 46306 TaxID=1389489 RepID=U3P8G3_LEIXC|nr:hypothetical protein [Leifsonia xyli]AGW42565.1 Na+/H+ antiporter [Leifsonia xyli subsp. cynodontis DSM 46306]